MDSSNHNPHDELIGSFLDGEVSPEEATFVQSLLDSDAEARRFYEELRSLGERLQAMPTPPLRADFTSRVMAEIERSDAPLVVPSGRDRSRGLRRPFRPRFGWGTVLAGLVAALLLFISWQNEPPRRQIAKNDADNAARTADAGPRVDGSPAKSDASNAASGQVASSPAADRNRVGPEPMRPGGPGEMLLPPPHHFSTDAPPIVAPGGRPSENRRGSNSSANEPAPQVANGLPGDPRALAPPSAGTAPLLLPAGPLMFVQIDLASPSSLAGDFVDQLREQDVEVYFGEPVAVPRAEGGPRQLDQLVQAFDFEPADSLHIVYVEATVSQLHLLMLKYPDAQLALEPTLRGGFDVNRLLGGTLQEAGLAEVYKRNQDRIASPAQAPRVGAALGMAYWLTGRPANVPQPAAKESVPARPDAGSKDDSTSEDARARPVDSNAVGVVDADTSAEKDAGEDAADDELTREELDDVRVPPPRVRAMFILVDPPADAGATE